MPARTKPSPQSGREPKGRHGAANDDARSDASVWEWVTAGFGVLIVVGMLSSIGYYGVSATSTVPAVRIEHAGTEAIPAGYVVRFRAINSSSATAAALRIAGELRDGNQLIESKEAVVDYLPGHSERQGGLFFRQDPGRYELTLYSVGYAEP